jgi:putative FmdB family regulatory protein
MTYTYECKSCGAILAAQQSIKDLPLEDCPKCGKPALKRLITQGAAFILKGGGWAADLYGKGEE